MASRVEQLNNKGIIAWQVEGGILARLTKKQSQDIEFAIRMQPLVTLGAVVAGHMKERVFNRGELAGAQAAPPSDRRGWHKEADGTWVPGQVVSLEYAAAAGLNTTTYASSADLHHATGKPGIGNVTGGLKDSLQARGSGQSSVILDFGGSSPGHGSGKPIFISTTADIGAEGGKPIPLMVRPPEMVRNQQKAWVLFNKHGCSPIEPTDTENVAMCEAATVQAQRAVMRTFGDGGDSDQQVAALDFGGDPSLRDKLIREWVK
jgi:hypothetical protein